MYRLYEQKIQKWIDNGKKALLIYGARQVGKTYLIRKMLERNDISYCEYNLIERTDILQYLQSATETADISSNLALYSGKELKEHESIIFLDEIQKYPDIVTKIKFLVDEGKYRYILSGSNLGVELKGIRSIPVGYAESIQMTPMNFEEFAIAAGISKAMLDHMKECFKNMSRVDEIVHTKLIQTFYRYLITGGMPAVINVYNETLNLGRIDEEQKNIIRLYKADFTRYEAENKKLKVISVYDNIPSQLNKQNLKFSFTLLNKELRFERYEESFLWLKDAAVAIPSYIVSEPKCPLQMSKETNVFKLFLSDVGLLTSCYPLSVKKELLEMDYNRELNNGALFENFVAQELYAGGLYPYYFKKQSMGEVDFVVENDMDILPIEVKSGKNYKNHAALNHMMENYDLKRAFVLSPYNLETTEKIIYLPIYMTGLLCEKQEDEDVLNISPL